MSARDSNVLPCLDGGANGLSERKALTSPAS